MLKYYHLIHTFSLFVLGATIPLKAMKSVEKWPYPSQKSYVEMKLPPYKYKPLSRPNRSSNNHVIPYSSYKMFRPEQKYDRFDKCYTVALTETLGITGSASDYLPIVDSQQLISQCNVIEKYYYPIKKPKKNCLVVFADSKRTITHFAIVTDAKKDNHSKTCWVKSKLGTIPHIYNHLLFDVPRCYRNKVSFYQLQKRFRQDKNILLQSIQSDIIQSRTIGYFITTLERTLITLAQGKDVFIKDDEEVNKQNSIAEKILYLFKTSLCLYADIQNSTNDSLLILATAYNQYDTMKILLGLGANSNHQNKQGHTALMGAVTFKHYKATRLLLANNAAIDLKDNSGWTALYYAHAVNNQHFIKRFQQ